MKKCLLCGLPSGNYFYCKKCYPKSKSLELYRVMLTKAWEDGKISSDERELMLALKNFFGISDDLHLKIEEEVKSSNKDLIQVAEELEKINNEFEKDYRRKFLPSFRTEDGHYVRSKNERELDNWFFSKEIVHIYEKNEINIQGQEVYCDFYLPYDSKGKFIGNQKGGIYVELWGLTEKEEYAKRMNQKKEFYKEKGLLLIDIYEQELHDLSTLLPKKFFPIFGDRVI